MDKRVGDRVIKIIQPTSAEVIEIYNDDRMMIEWPSGMRQIVNPALYEVVSRTGIDPLPRREPMPWQQRLTETP